MDECHNPYVINSMWCLKMKNRVIYNPYAINSMVILHPIIYFVKYKNFDLLVVKFR